MVRLTWFYIRVYLRLFFSFDFLHLVISWNSNLFETSIRIARNWLSGFDRLWLNFRFLHFIFLPINLRMFNILWVIDCYIFRLQYSLPFTTCSIFVQILLSIQSNCWTYSAERIIMKSSFLHVRIACSFAEQRRSPSKCPFFLLLSQLQRSAISSCECQCRRHMNICYIRSLFIRTKSRKTRLWHIA